MAAIGTFPNGIRLNESFEFTLQFTQPVNEVDPSLCRFDMLFQTSAGAITGWLPLSSDVGGGLTIGAMDPTTRNFTVAARVLDISTAIPVGTYVGFLRMTDPTGFKQDLVVWQPFNVIPY